LRPSSGALNCVYSLWYKAPTMLPAGDQDEVELFQKMGEIIARNMLSWLQLSIKSFIVASSWLFILLYQWCTVTQTQNSLYIV